jgi:putative transposase
MARPLRIQFENAYYHVTCRGNARQIIFVDDADRSAFLSLLSQSQEIYHVDILGYVLMRNHFHFLLKTPRANLQEFMRQFNISYTSHYNRRHKRTGHLYQGRYKSFLVDADNYLQEVSRYIHLNPVRVKGKSKLSLMEKDIDLRNDPWNSYRGYVWPRYRVDFLRVAEVLVDFGGDTKRGRGAYEGFLKEGMGIMLDSPIAVGKGHGIVGAEDFMERMRGLFKGKGVRSREVPALRKLIAKVEAKKIISTISKLTGVEEERILGRGNRNVGRGLVMEMLYRYGGLNQREIGERMGVDYSSVSVGRRRLREAMELDKGIAELVGKVDALLNQE